MSRTLEQIYIANPIVTNTATDLMYFSISPYTAGNDAGMAFSDFAAQFISATGVLPPANGGTGVNNGTNTITVGGNFETVGAFTSQFTMTGNTAVTFPTSGTLATTSQLPTPAALTRVDDTNVTLTLGGSPSTALLQATSLTLGWTGELSVARGGTGRASATEYAVICGGTTATGAQQSIVSVGTSGQVLTSNGAGALPTFQAIPSTGTVNTGNINEMAYYAATGTTVSGLTTANRGLLVTSNTGVPSILSSPATTGQILQSNAAAAPSYSTSSYPSTNAANTLLYASSANVMAALPTANNGILVTSAGGVPSIGNTVGAGLTMPSITFNTTTGIVGTTTNNNAAAGSVGELISSVITAGSAIAVGTSNTAKNLTSISLTAGDWDVWGNILHIFASGTNYTALLGWISTTSATQPDASLIDALSGGGSVPGVGSGIGLTPPVQRFSLASTTTIYISQLAVYTVSTITMCGGIYARRVR